MAPAVSLLVLGLCAWGGYYWLGRQVQAVADEALAAAASELDSNAREGRAKAVAAKALLLHWPLSPSAMQLSVASRSDRLTVLMVYDVSRSPLFALEDVLPMPSPLIARSASEVMAPGRAATAAVAADRR